MYQARKALVRDARAARARAVSWMLQHVRPDGEPADAEVRTGWMRLGWGLAVAGETDAASAVVSWIAANRLGADGRFQPGRMEGQPYVADYPAYWLATFVMSARETGRTGVAMRSMDALRSMQDPKTGGLPMAAKTEVPICDVLSTAQTGLSALALGQRDVADACYRWLATLGGQQDASKDLRFHMFAQGGALVTQPPAAFASAALCDFSKPRQAFYGPGMAAVFLAPYSAITGNGEALELARRFVAFNLRGHGDQFDDVESVQACKFAWAVAVMQLHDAGDLWAPWVPRMTQWYLDRQSPEGWWGPSRFADPTPSIADRLIKTSEHAMQLTALIAALA